MTTNLVTEIPSYFVGDTEYFVRVFPYPNENEIDFEVYTANEEFYLFTITSNRPELSTSVIRKYIQGEFAPEIIHSTLWGN